MQKLFLVSLAFFLGVLIFIYTGQFSSRRTIEELSNRSIDPEIALTNGRPTVYEFYADWCLSCREMAPTILTLEEQYKDSIDIVLLNVDNPTMTQYLKSFDVKGIPHLSFFDKEGSLKGKLVGLRTEEELKDYFNRLIAKEDLPTNFLDAKISELKDKPILKDDVINPMSHS